MYTTFKTYDVLPTEKGVKRNYTDTADTGSDYLCSICYIDYRHSLYITDVLYTKKAMEFTEKETARMIVANDTEHILVESNNGGRGFARNVEANVRNLGNYKATFKTFTQHDNKHIRIFSHSADVQNMVYYPSNWERMFPDFAKDVKGFLNEGTNSHDDAPDVLTGMVEALATKKKSGIIVHN